MASGRILRIAHRMERSRPSAHHRSGAGGGGADQLGRRFRHPKGMPTISRWLKPEADTTGCERAYPTHPERAPAERFVRAFERIVLAPLRGAVTCIVVRRWCRFAQPPANGFEPSRFRRCLATRLWSRTCGELYLSLAEILLARVASVVCRLRVCCRPVLGRFLQRVSQNSAAVRASASPWNQIPRLNRSKPAEGADILRARDEVVVTLLRETQSDSDQLAVQPRRPHHKEGKLRVGWNLWCRRLACTRGFGGLLVRGVAGFAPKVVKRRYGGPA